MKTAVIYARYSSDAQTEQSIEGQLRDCNKYAKDHDLLVVDTYIDRAMTGTNDNRAAFQKMIKDSAKKQWSVVIVYKLDRFSRNKYESVIHKKTLKDNGVRLISAMENIPDSPEGTLMEALLEGFNQYFSEELAQKVNRGIRESWIKGYCTGQYVFGYDVIDKKYVINEYEAGIIRETFTKYSEGYKAKAIETDLQARGARRKNGKLIDQKYIYQILHNIRYTGKTEHHGVWYDNIFPRIISDELWYKVSTICDENKHSPSRKKEIYDYILSGKLICGNCRHRMSGISGTSKTGDVHYYYICSAKHLKKNACQVKAVLKQPLEDLVIHATVGMLNKNDNIEKIAKGLSLLHKKETADNKTLKLLVKQHGIALKASTNLIHLIEQGIITEQTKTRLVELESEIRQLEFAINREKSRTYDFLPPETIEEYLRSKICDDPQDIRVRKMLVNTFIREVILYDKKITITYNFTDNHDKVDFSQKSITEREKQFEDAPQAAFHLCLGSYILRSAVPKKAQFDT